MRISDWSSDVCSSDPTGGVGSLAVDIFSSAGYAVHAISGKPEHADYLKAIGATEVLGRDALATSTPMESARFGGGLDNVGGPMLARLLAQPEPYGNVASAGLDRKSGGQGRSVSGRLVVGGRRLIQKT